MTDNFLHAFFICIVTPNLASKVTNFWTQALCIYSDSDDQEDDNVDDESLDSVPCYRLKVFFIPKSEKHKICNFPLIAGRISTRFLYNLNVRE